MKRARGDMLTGGTGDVSPQFMTVSNVMTVANTYSEVQVPIPLARINTRKGKALVMEALKFYVDMPIWDANPAAGGSSATATAQLSTLSQTAVSFGFSTVFAWQQKEYRGAFTAAGSELSVSVEPRAFDMSDAAGHGVLIATENIFFGVNTSGYTGVGGFSMKLLYRFKEVSVEEYIGIVQSQQ